MTEVSLIASSNRPGLYRDFFDSLEGTTVSYEVIFAGNKLPPIQYPCEYILTKNIKPAQCYEIARRHAKGETIIWVADDCEFPNDVLGKAYRHWKSKDNYKLILSIQTKESGYHNFEGKLFPMNMHRFFGFKQHTPLMAPIGLMSRQFLEDLGGFDRRYVAGQYENDAAMNAYMDGGFVEVFGDKDCYIDIDHYGKLLRIGEIKDKNDFLKRPFATGYQKDREVLEKSWVPLNGQRHDKFEPYEDKDLLTKSQSNKGQWE